jgi:hypothetical protein
LPSSPGTAGEKLPDIEEEQDIRLVLLDRKHGGLYCGIFLYPMDKNRRPTSIIYKTFQERVEKQH